MTPLPLLDDRITAVVATVAATGGLARTSTVLAAGASAHVVEIAVARKQLQRPRKGWLATPEADPELQSAVKAGVVLTCVTQARRLGLWIPEGADGIPHVGASGHSGAVKVTRSRVHWGRTPLPRHPDSVVDPVENVLAAIAVCQPWEAAVVMWESALNKGLVTRTALQRLELPPAARRVLAAARPWSDSGLETIFTVRLAWLKLSIVPQAWIEGHRVDLLIGERLVVQIDGATHTGRQRDEDIAHDARLKLLGYHVIRVSYAQIVSRWHEVQDLIMRAVAQGLHLAA